LARRGVEKLSKPSLQLPTGTITFLFTDIEGSTRLLKALGRERYGELLATHNLVLREALEGAGGIGVDRKGDSFFAAFTSAGAAVTAAAAAQLALAREEWAADSHLKVRMGLHTGEALVGGDGYVGFAVHQAARIGDIGHGGQVLLSSMTATLVEHDLPAEVGLRDLGETKVPDFERPERLFQLVIPGLPDTFPPVGRRDARPAYAEPYHHLGGRPLLEREAEVAAIHGVVKMAAEGGGRLLAIEGRAGMGKTRLVTEARAAAEAEGFQVLAARSSELEQDFAYCVLRQLFEPLLATVDPEQRAELFAGAASLAERLFQEAQLDAEGSDISFGMLHGLYWLAANTASRGPTLIAIDDLHWSDGPSLRWLAYLSRRLEGLPLAVVVGFRPPEQSQQAELLTELVADPDAMLIRPAELGIESVLELATTQFDREPERPFAEACLVATGGNPLFLRALLATMAGEGLDPLAVNADRVLEIGPESVTRAVGLRLTRLPAEAKSLARAAAVLGDGTQLRHAAALAGLDLEVASHAATALVRADLLRLRTRNVEFTHPVVRAAVYETIDPADRALAHRRAAEQILLAGGALERAAGHVELVPPRGDHFVVATLREAAARSLGQGAPDTSVAYLSRALEEPPELTERVETLIELGLAERRVDIQAAARHLETALDEVEDPVRRARVALELGRSLFRLNRGPDAVDVFDDAIERLGGGPADLRNMLEAELINAAGFDPEVIEISSNRIARVREEELEDGVGRAVMIATLRYFDARRGVNREAVAELGRPEVVRALIESTPSVAISCAATALMFAEIDEDTDRFFKLMLAAAKERGELVTLSNMLCFRGLTCAWRGDLDAAIQDLRESGEIVSYLPTQQGSIYFHSYLADVLTNRGEIDEAEAVLAELGIPEDVPRSGHMIFFLGARGWVRLARRDYDAARADYERLGAYMESFGMRNPAVVAWRSHLALPLLALERRDEALELAREELELARAWGAPRPIGVALRTRGLAEGGETGIETLRESLTVLEASSAKLERARTIVELGAALRRSNQGAEARELLRQGLEIAHGTGAQPLVEDAQSELAAAGARPPRPVLSRTESLTPRERRVAEMAAEEMTSKDIAQELFVTTKTVEVHLSNAYRKLEIDSRNDLPAALGLAPVVPAVPAL
jgi:class 3 adenylate cyclase/DNA-binding CsgD family transcriptional regulator